ncbi:MAG TPA: hypothetical protein VGN13_07060 [Solirubrobacteraceae bacterium]|jgi:hypothetical protein
MLLGLGVLGALCASASAQAGWGLDVVSRPSHLRPGGLGTILIKPVNVGSSTSAGTVTVTDTLPTGVTATSAGTNKLVVGAAEPEESQPELRLGPKEAWSCSGNGPEGAVAGATVVTCVNNPAVMPGLTGGGGTPTGPGEVELSEYLQFLDPEIAIGVRLPASEGVLGEPNRVTMIGGGAPAGASASDPVTVTSQPTPFGFEHADAWFSNADGSIDTQAGSHPYEATFVVDFNTVLKNFAFAERAEAEARNVTFNLPPGFVGNPNVVPKCALAQFNAQVCPAAAQVGIADPEVLGEDMLGSNGLVEAVPVYNLVPPPGEPAQFGFLVAGVQSFIGTGVRSGGNYAIKSQVNDIPQRDVTGSFVTLWGVPGDPSHDHYRANQGKSEFPSAPFLTLPTSCNGPQEFSASVNSWERPGEFSRVSFLTHDANRQPVGFTGCGDLAFGPTVTMEPDTTQADHPAGLTVEVKPPVGGLMAGEGLSTADIQNTTVRLPAGFVINPGQAAGLASCPDGRPGPGRPGDALTTAEERAKGEEDDGAPQCPGAAKVGEAEIETPLLPRPLKGAVYVLQSNPPEVKLLVAASGEGVNVKLVGIVHLDTQTGQITTKFEGTPELPFTNFKLAFSGGAQAALATPAQCGTYGPAQGFAADFNSWASPFIADFFPSAEFALNSGPNGGPCPSSPLPFHPELTAGSTTDQAGAFTNFSLLLQRGDGQQRIEKLQFREPAGLAGMISSVPLCPEPQASQGACPESSKIGHAAVASGPGPYPLTIPQPGEPESPIFLTGPYQGAPFGLSILTHVIAGPFNLGDIVTRAKIEIDPRTAQITVTTDPFPQIVAGVPTDLRLIDSVIDRPGFLFNPTNCTPAAFEGTAWGTPPPGAGGPGATAAISSHFGIGSCRELAFTPQLTTSTAATPTKAHGASLSFKIAYPKGAIGSQSWFNEAKFDIPKQLPARLTTLQQACLVATFETNRAACPAASIIGHAIVHTPVLPVPLEGPVYFVSHGGAKFPDAVLVLEGDGVKINLTGETFINGKTGVTSATFRDTPDVPFENIEVTLPTGPFSEFGANLPAAAHGSFCGQKLVMPTAFKAQNGREIHQNTPVGVSGCSSKISIRSHTLHTRTLTISVYVPAAGKLTASGNGLSSSSKSTKGQEIVTLTLHAKHAKHFNTRLKLTFKAGKGTGQRMTSRVRG